MTFGTHLLRQGGTVSRISGYLCTERSGSNRGRQKNHLIGWNLLNVLPNSIARPPSSTHVFPEITLVFVTAVLETLEVAARNDAQDLAVPDQRQMAKAAVPHQA